MLIRLKEEAGVITRAGEGTMTGVIMAEAVMFLLSVPGEWAGRGTLFLRAVIGQRLKKAQMPIHRREPMAAITLGNQEGYPMR
jgi:hypothetical protein